MLPETHSPALPKFASIHCRDRKLDCAHGSCNRCGFATIWSLGLRLHIIDNKGDVKPDAPVEFQSKLTWQRCKTSNNKSPGEAKEALHEDCSGTIVQFLDEFEKDIMG